MRRPAPRNDVAVAYIRASTDEQRLGPEAQRAAIEAWAAREHVTVASWHVDQGVSGGSDLDDRPALVAALAQLRSASAGILVVAKRDRLARDVYIACAIERAASKCGALVHAADGVGNGGTPADAFMRSILDAAAQYERGLIRSRTRAALRAKKARGERCGTPPFGYRVSADGIALELDEAEQAVSRRVSELRGAGESLRTIARRLCEEGRRSSRTGRAFGKSQVAEILRAASASG